MSDSSYLQLTRVTESTPGTTPGSPSMTKVRVTGESFVYDLSNIESEEIRADRLTADLIPIGGRVNGGFNFEMSYGAFDEEIESAMLSTWQNMPELENVTADSTITQVTDSSDTVTVDAGGDDFVANHLVRASGFTNSANNDKFKVSSSTTTTIVYAGTPTLTDEAAPPAGARIKVIGFQGDTGDIESDGTGLISSSLDFTTLGLAVGQWIKIGGSTTAEQFATAGVNDFARITSIAANDLNLDNLPSGWGTDNGSGKTITVYVSDYIRVGTTKKHFSYEKVITSQTTPYYQVLAGCQVGTMNLNFRANAVLTGSFDFLGFSASGSTSAQDATPDEAPQNDVLAASTNVGRIAEAGSVVTSPNHMQEFNLALNNNLREQNAIGTVGMVGVGVGSCQINGTLRAYFGDETLLDKYLANTATTINVRVAKNSQAQIYTLPNVKLSSANTNASARNQDVVQEIGFTALKDTTTGTSFQIDRFEEYAA